MIIITEEFSSVYCSNSTNIHSILVYTNNIIVQIIHYYVRDKYDYEYIVCYDVYTKV